MAKQVSAAAYDLCVADGACRARDAASPSGPDVPAVSMSWVDATSYARWLSDRTGDVWRLPTDEEWVFAAGSRAVDDALPDDAGDDFSDRWLARYEQEARRERLANGAPRPIGTFGVNENGVVDIAGNVWEWTDTCFMRRSLDGEGNLLDDGVVNCGVRVVEGAHRTYMTDFIRDAKSGGCGVGTPPANLGFRLVREAHVDRLVAR
jgi:formylglycine-generating enzyme required for sulfatase activity